MLVNEPATTLPKPDATTDIDLAALHLQLTNTLATLDQLQASINSKPVKVDPVFQEFVDQAQYLTKEVSNTNQEVRAHILRNFVGTHYTKIQDDTGMTTYEPLIYTFKAGTGVNAPVKTVSTAVLTNNTNLVPCSLDVHYQYVIYKNKKYEIDTKICFNSTGLGYIESLVASTADGPDIDLSVGIPLNVANARQKV